MMTAMPMPPLPCPRARRAFRPDVRGASLVEYIICIGFVALVATTAVRLFGGTVADKLGEQARAVASLDAARGSSQAVSYFGPEQQAGSVNDPGQPTGIGEWLLSWVYDLNDHRLARAKKLLQETPTGRRALETLASAPVTVQFRVGRGSYFLPSKRTLTLDAEQDADHLAAILVHETSHVSSFFGGHMVQPDTELSREEYIDAMLAEEGEGIRREADLTMELAARGTEITPSFAANIYLRAYRSESDQIRRAHPDLPDSEVDCAARRVASDRIDEAMRRGALRSSVDGATAETQYGRIWDRHHPRR
jgi:pilus assembly protein Flp/PilA